MSATLLLHADALRVYRAPGWCSPVLDMKLRGGQVLLLGGGNGAGKSSVLRVLAGLYGDYRGICRRYAQLSYVGHRFAHKTRLSLECNLHWYCALMGGSTVSASECMERFGLMQHAKQPVASLSAGQRQRASLARLLLNNAPIWLLDEPEQSLDTQGRRLLDELVEEHCGRGGGVVRTKASSGELRVHGESEHAATAEPSIDAVATADRDDTTCAAPGAVPWALWRRDARLLWREHRVWRMPLLYALAVILPALVVVLDRTMLEQIAPVLMWSLALLVIFVGGDGLCADDWEDDTLAQIVLARVPLWHLALVRIVTLWCTVFVPMALVTVPLGLMLGASAMSSWVMMLSMMVGGFSLSALMAVGGALCAPIRDRSVLSGLMFVPLALPVLLFGALASEVATVGASVMPAMALQAALALAALVLLTPLVVMGWRISAGT